MRPVLVKVTSKNQVTLPDALMRAIGRPSHFKAFVSEGNLVLFSARLATYDDQAKDAGIPATVLKRAYALHAEQAPDTDRAAADRGGGS